MSDEYPGTVVMPHVLPSADHCHWYLRPVPEACTLIVYCSPRCPLTFCGCWVIANGAYTVTVMVADFRLPSVEVAVMVAVPGAIPVMITVPLASTAATSVLDDDHSRVVLVAFEGSTTTVG